MECFLISLLNYIWNINSFLYSFFCHIDICSSQRMCWKYECIFMLFFGIFFVIFGVFMTAILEWVCQSCNFNNASPFLFCSFESIDLSLNQTIYLPTSNLPTNLSTLSYLIKFSKSIFISQNSVIYQNREIQIQTKALYELFWVL